MKDQRFPEGWDAARVKSLLDRYEHQSEEEAAAEDEAAFDSERVTAMDIRTELVPAVRSLLASHGK